MEIRNIFLVKFQKSFIRNDFLDIMQTKFKIKKSSQNNLNYLY